MQTTNHISELLLKKLAGTLSPSEQSELDTWTARSIGNKLLLEEITDMDALADDLLHFNEERLAISREELFRRINDDIDPGQKVALQLSPRIRLINRWAKYAAAILILLSGLAVYFNLFHASPSGDKVVGGVTQTPANDVLPGFNRAVLTLSDGRQVQLDSAAFETIKDGALSIRNVNGRLSYGATTGWIRSPSGAGEVVAVAYNTMATPKGGQYQLTLADGTKVWLNASSSIKYPTIFIEKNREVTITGEAYFEIAKSKDQPFIVKTLSDEIVVLGTSFNVNIYADEPVSKISLIEGSIKINKNTILKPGEAFRNGRVIKTNTETDIAWKNGFFAFNNADIKTVMRQLSRWYDIDVRYEGTVSTARINGEIGRNLTLSQVLKILASLRIKYKIEGKALVLLNEK